MPRHNDLPQLKKKVTFTSHRFYFSSELCLLHKIFELSYVESCGIINLGQLIGQTIYSFNKSREIFELSVI